MKILTAIDFSDSSDDVLRVTASLASNLSASVWLVHVAEPEPAFVGFDAGPEVVRDQIAAEFRDEHVKLQALADELREGGIKTKALLVQGAIVTTLLELAEKQNTDLIIVGSHGRSAITNLVVGSVSAGLIRQSPCPVTVVPRRR